MVFPVGRLVEVFDAGWAQGCVCPNVTVEWGNFGHGCQRFRPKFSLQLKSGSIHMTGCEPNQWSAQWNGTSCWVASISAELLLYSERHISLTCFLCDSCATGVLAWTNTWNFDVNSFDPYYRHPMGCVWCIPWCTGLQCKTHLSSTSKIEISFSLLHMQSLLHSLLK